MRKLTSVLIAATASLVCGAANAADVVQQSKPENIRFGQAKLRKALPVAPAGRLLDRTAPFTRIAFGSCVQQNRSMDFWEQIAAERPQLFMMIGDNVYGDTRWQGQADLPTLREAYATLAAREEFRRFRADVPMLATWDDHDFGLNDAGGNFAFKERAEQLFEHFWKSPQDVVGRPGVYQSVIVGPVGRRVQVILLDTRYFRSDLVAKPYQEPAPAFGWYAANPDPQATILGKAQWNWLENELAKPAEVRLVVSSIQLLTGAHDFEKWGNFPGERKRLIHLLHKAGNAVILSGDRHRAGVYHDPGTDLWELTSSSLNLPFAGSNAEVDPIRTQGLFSDENYALIDFDWSSATLHFRLRKSANGQALGNDQAIPMRRAKPAGGL